VPSISATGHDTKSNVRSPLPGERVEIPSGSLQVGSKPGTPGRQPSFEPTPYSIELGSFEIDRLPYPNDPARPIQVAVTRDEARALCARSGSRLCTELEWERACKGPENRQYSTGDHLDARCKTNPAQCTSSFDVLAMGMTSREWTSSDFGSSNEAMAIARGSTADFPDEAHRCSARQAFRATSNDKAFGLRCCRGAPNAARVKDPVLGRAFQKATISLPQLTQLLQNNAISKGLAEGVQLFREPEAAETVVEKGTGDRKGLTFSVAPVMWNPGVGVQFLLIVGRSGKDVSFVLAYNVVAKDDYALASSFTMKSETGPVALAYDESIRTRLFFSTCWGCPGETGKILFREPESVAILQP
jgi:hypothetical protein